MQLFRWHVAAIASLALPFAAPAHAAEPLAQIGDVALKPILDTRLRYEAVDQGPLDADAVTLRLRAGAEARLGRVAVLAEGEATLATLDQYNAFPFGIADRQRRPDRSVIPDPENLELNRLQLQYQAKALTVTVGRQRINLDDQRWVGAVGWRQNEQTFDAVRAEARIGPVQSDIAYAVKQRTIFGVDAGPRTAYDGHFILAGAASAIGPVQAKLFAYLLDYDEPFFHASSSQTYGGTIATAVPLGRLGKLALRASHARQSAYGSNPFHYSAGYWSVEGKATGARVDVTAGWERLGSDHGHPVQTPMATLHKFNGWADMFLATPAAGLQDAYVIAARKFDRFLPGFNASLTFHQFDSAVGNVEYGTEWDASAGFKLGKVALLAKFADYDAKRFGVDTRKVWLQAEWAF